MTIEQMVSIERMEHAAELFGSFDANIDILRESVILYG